MLRSLCLALSLLLSASITLPGSARGGVGWLPLREVITPLCEAGENGYLVCSGYVELSDGHVCAVKFVRPDGSMVLWRGTREGLIRECETDSFTTARLPTDQ